MTMMPNLTIPRFGSQYKVTVLDTLYASRAVVQDFETQYRAEMYYKGLAPENSDIFGITGTKVVTTPQYITEENDDINMVVYDTLDPIFEQMLKRRSAEASYKFDVQKVPNVSIQTKEDYQNAKDALMDDYQNRANTCPEDEPYTATFMERRNYTLIDKTTSDGRKFPSQIFLEGTLKRYHHL